MSLTIEVGFTVPETALNADVHEDTLGRLAVGSEVNVWTEDEQTTDQILRLELACIRDELGELTPRQVERFDAFCAGVVHEDIQAEKQTEAPDTPWSHWLGRGSDRQLMDYLSWNLESVRQQQDDPRFQEHVAEQRHQYKLGTHRGLGEDWLHADAEEAIYSVDNLAVYIGDGFTTQARGWNGYHVRDTKDVIIAGARAILSEGYEDLYKRIPWVAPHEFTHPFGQFDIRWWDEAATEHRSQVIVHGQPEIIRPNDRRKNFNQAYAAERALAADVFGPLPAWLLTKAHSETSGQHYFNRMVDGINGLWKPYVPVGESAFDRLNTRVLALENQYQAEGFSEIDAGRRAATEVRHMLAKDPRAVFAVQDGSEQFQRLLTQ